jgi:chromosome segregation ATPase
MPRPPFSHAQEDSSPPPKRAKLGYTDREAAEAESSNDTEVDDSPTTNKLTMIGSSVLAKLRDDKTQLLAANGELAKDNVKLKKKLADEEKIMAENNVLKVENKALENSLEKEQAENEELQVELSKLRAEKIQMQGTIDYYAGQDGELRQQLQHGQQEYAQLQRDYEGLVAAYNELNARVRAAGAPDGPEPEFDLVEGFPRYE